MTFWYFMNIILPIFKYLSGRFILKRLKFSEEHKNEKVLYQGTVPLVA